MTRLMKLVLLAAALVAAPAAASAQEASSFDALAGRLRVGQEIWVTDLAGREVRGRLVRLSSDTLVLETGGQGRFGPPDVRRIRARDRDSLRNGALAGLATGGAMAAAWCIGANADDSSDVDARVECAEGIAVYPALGALAGLLVDAVIPGKIRVVYQTAPRSARPFTGTVVSPWLSARRGLAVSFTF